jgi:hypothetical protein
MIYYHLSRKPAGDIRLQIFDSAGKLVRTMTSVAPPKVERAPYPEYWLKSPEERALPTKIGTNRTNWNLRYDDPPGFNQDINNQMNSTPDSVTPGPHGPLVLPGTYTMKLTVDGTTYTQNVVVYNDPRIGETTVTIADLRSQNRLALSAWNGMKDSFAANDKAANVRAQLATLMKGTLPQDVKSAAAELDTKLAGFGSADGRGPGRGGFGGFGGQQRTPGSVLPFYSINGLYYTVLGPLSQNGIDMPPTIAMIHTWESSCKEYTATALAWKTLVESDIAGFNSLLAKNNLTPLNTEAVPTPPTSCNFQTGGRK